jgi:hypothetical protein
MQHQPIVLLIGRCDTRRADLKSTLSPFRVVESRDMPEAVETLNHTNPHVIVLGDTAAEDTVWLDALPKATEREYIPIIRIDCADTPLKSVDAALTLSLSAATQNLRAHIVSLLK